MAWTQADADAVHAAILALVTGTRVVSVSYAGPPARSLTYQMADLADLRAIAAEIQRSIGGGGYRLAATSKGLGGGRGSSGGGWCW